MHPKIDLRALWRTGAQLRFGAVMALVLCAMLAGCAHAGAGADWPRYRFDLRNSGHNPGELGLSPSNVGELEMLWHAPGMGSPVVRDGVVYVYGAGEQTYAFDAASGAQRWASAGSSSFLNVLDGVVYTISNEANLLAFSAASGRTLWTRPFPSQRQDSGLNVVDGIIYAFGTGGLSAFRASDGAPVWNAPLSGVSIGAPAIVGDMIYATSTVPAPEHVNAPPPPPPADDAPPRDPMVVLEHLMTESPRETDVYGVRLADGAVVWRMPVDGISRSSLAVVDGAVFLGTYLGTVYALDAATGAVKWRNVDSERGGLMTSVAVAQGRLFFATVRGNVYALDAESGRQIWHMRAGGPFISSPAVANGVVYVGSFDKKAYALDAATGATLWSFETGHAISSSPAVADGRVYLGSDVVAQDGQIYAFGLPGR